MNLKVAVITPHGASDVLGDTILDGLMALTETDRGVSFFIPAETGYDSNLSLAEYSLDRDRFVDFAARADLIFLIWGKRQTAFNLAEIINRWDRTVFIDGAELGGNRRLDPVIQQTVLTGDYQGQGGINREMLDRCALYFRREKPYLTGVQPLPFGIERRYRDYLKNIKVKDLDLFCVFGQIEYPPLRREGRELVRDFAKNNNLKAVTEPTTGFRFDAGKHSGREEFYRLLARSKIGISISGGGFDTARFWEILGNNCLLLTETIDIFRPEDRFLDYRRIRQFADLEELQMRLEEAAGFIKTDFPPVWWETEYQDILTKHSSQARVETIFQTAAARGIIAYE